MRRFRRSLLIALLGVACLGQTASLMADRNVRRVGMKLACLCGVCKNTVGDCAMMGCSYAGGRRERIAQMLKAGVGDEQIVAKFVKDDGLKALAVPPAEGFNLMAWVMPGVMLLLGLYAIYVYVRRMRRPVPVPAGSMPSRYRELAEKDLNKLE